MTRHHRTHVGRLLLTLAAALALGGCSQPEWMGHWMSDDTDWMPRAGRLAEVAPIGGDQVRFTFTFKYGADPAPGARPRPVGVEEGSMPRITLVRFNDSTGHTFSVADQEVHSQDNVYTVVLTSGPVARDTYAVTCQSQIAVAGYVVRLTGTAFRQADGWQDDPQGFDFARYRSDDKNVPVYERVYANYP
ncbi:MAG: hypothetical protein BIFFINMI_02856 [Phycisphaerae bacterium]|nr:hypothetical protein [Phycisphaerae bacterium]